MIDGIKCHRKDLSAFLIKNIGTENFNKDRYGLSFFVDRLGGPCISSSKVVTVAGTNGKGQTIIELEKFSRDAGQTSMSFSSPHLLCPCERVRKNGENICHETFYQEAHAVLATCSRHYITLSYFEFVFIVFLKICKKQAPDYIFLEVGLGGRLDATNEIDSDVAVLTSISRDHVEFLGNSYQKIILEKLEISRKGKPFVLALSLCYLRKIAKGYLEKKEAKEISLDLKTKNNFERNQRIALRVWQELGEKVSDSVSPAPDYRRSHFCFESLSISYCGAHNVGSIRSFVNYFIDSSQIEQTSRLILSFSERPDNEIKIMLKILKRLKTREPSLRISLTSFMHPRAKKVTDMRYLATEEKFEFIDDWKKWFTKNKKSAESIFLLGSYYFVGECLGWFLSECEK